jgi:hypothetical protein
MKISVCLEHIFIGVVLMLISFVSTAYAEMSSVYGGPVSRLLDTVAPYHRLNFLDVRCFRATAERSFAC